MNEKSFYKIKEILEFVWNSSHSSFYRDKYEKAGLTKEGLFEADNFSKVPFLNRQELQDTDPLRRLFITKEEIYFAAYSSGTTSQEPLITYYAKIKNYLFDPTLGLKVSKLLFLFPPINRHFSHTLAQQCEESKTGSYPIFGDINNFQNSAVISQKCGIDALYATPTLAVMFFDSLKKYYDPARIKLVALCGETLSGARRAQLRELYPSAKIVNLYASSEIGQYILFPCHELIEKDLELFHPHPALLEAELMADGELVITYAENQAMPLIRYKTGDMFEVTESACACDKKTLRWLGRVNSDIVRIGGMEFKATDLERVMTPFLGLIGDKYQVHFYQKQMGTSLETEMIIELIAPPSQETAVSVMDQLMKHWRLSSSSVLEDAVMKGLILKPQVKFVKEFSFKTGKTRRLINHI